jgi:hypothetical protein
MNSYIIDEQTVQAILSYLAQRPYSEVVNGIQALQNLKKIEEDERKDKKPA